MLSSIRLNNRIIKFKITKLWVVFWLNKKLNKMADIKPKFGKLVIKNNLAKIQNLKNCLSENISVLGKPFSINMIGGIKC